MKGTYYILVLVTLSPSVNERYIIHSSSCHPLSLSIWKGDNTFFFLSPSQSQYMKGTYYILLLVTLSPSVNERYIIHSSSCHPLSLSIWKGDNTFFFLSPSQSQYMKGTYYILLLVTLSPSVNERYIIHSSSCHPLNLNIWKVHNTFFFLSPSQPRIWKVHNTFLFLSPSHPQ